MQCAKNFELKVTKLGLMYDFLPCIDNQCSCWLQAKKLDQ